MVISLAPLQGYTEYPFRNALANIIGGVDRFYTPYFRFENDGTLRKKHIQDILPENNAGINVTPQILVNNAADFLKLAHIIENYGYTEVNWNLGCPYPMVAKRQLGSGLLAMPDTINEILNEVIPKTNLKISIKMRSGYLVDTDINKVIEVLNQFPLAEIIYHPRIGKQLYKGAADIEKFAEILPISNHALVYNGDIDCISKFSEIHDILPDVTHFMIGRGLIANPFLASEIAENKSLDEPLKRKQFIAFHEELLNHFSNELSGDSHLLNKFIHFWEYFSELFVEDKKAFKMIKKCKSLTDLKKSTDFIMSNCTFKNQNI